MSLSVGIVGLPNVGKSTLFNALLKRQVALSANYPFATIEPNVGVVPVPDPRLEMLAKIVNTTIVKPAVVEFIDIAGLVKGASQGEGLGNQFLAHIREVDLICHVLRGFSDTQVLREGSVSPEEDKSTIETELLLADLATLEKQKPPKASKDKDELDRWRGVEVLLETIKNGNLIYSAITDEKTLALAKELSLLTAKPIIYAINVDEADLSRQSELQQEFATRLEVLADEVLIISAQIESELSSLSEEDQKLYLDDLGLQQGGLERLIQKVYLRLGLQSFLTAGEKEVRAWTIKKGTRAQDASGVIHSDFVKKFIKANVVGFDEFVEVGGWKGAKDLGKIRLEGRDYPMREGDVVEFMIGG